MEFGYEFESFNPGLGGGLAIGAAGVVTAVLLIFVLLGFALAVVQYVLCAVGMYRIAKRRGIHHAWLAWLPVGDAWLLGSISDHYQYVAKRKTTRHRTVMLVLHIVISCIGFVYGLLAGLLGVSEDPAGAIGMVALIVIAYLLLMGVAIAASVFSYISFYDLFQSCKPGNAVLFLVLSILFNVALPFFVFACSKYDDGMPARRAPRPVEAPYTPAEEEAPVEAEPVEQIPVVEAEPTEEELPVVEAEPVEEEDTQT